MEALLIDWLGLLVRFVHVIAAIAWIGASFYFVWLDNSLTSPPAAKDAQGIRGDLWAFHGGGIYEVNKYRLAPPAMPDTLHWFKWEAYATWITGALLLMAVYYLRADLYLIEPGKWLASPAAAIAASVLFLAAGLAVYELLMRRVAEQHPRRFLALLLGFIALWCWLSVHLFSDRAAFLHVGAMLATIMAANVLLGIMPAQRGFMRALERGETPLDAPMQKAKQRSVHNNYFTLPVLLCMISNHYAFLYSHPHNWVILIIALAAVAWGRHFFNLRHRGIVKPQILMGAGAVGAALMAWTLYPQLAASRAAAAQSVAAPVAAPSARRADQPEFALMQTHCAVCHAAEPTQPGFAAAPAGLRLDSLAAIDAASQRSAAAIASGYMPLANLTQLSYEERAQLLQWLQ